MAKVVSPDLITLHSEAFLHQLDVFSLLLSEMLILRRLNDIFTISVGLNVIHYCNHFIVKIPRIVHNPALQMIVNPDNFSVRSKLFSRTNNWLHRCS